MLYIAFCVPGSLEDPRAGGSWVIDIANKLVHDGFEVEIRGIPYAPLGRKTNIYDVLDPRVTYKEAWVHNISDFDVAYITYTPISKLFFRGNVAKIAGIHAMIYVSKYPIRYFGITSNIMGVLHKFVGKRELLSYDAVHSITKAFTSPHPNTYYIPNFIDTKMYNPQRAKKAEKFTVLVTTAHIPRKGWDVVVSVAERLPKEISIVSTGETGHPNIRGLGFLPEEDLADWYARAHVLLNPSREDVDSLSIKKACACGTPVITTPIPTHKAMFDNEEGAILYADGVEETLKCILELYEEWVSDRKKYFERCKRARKLAEEYDFKILYPKFKKMLCEVAEKSFHKEVI